MNLNVLDAFLKKFYDSNLPRHNENLQLCWHAGEPLAAPLKWYEKAHEIIENRSYEFVVENGKQKKRLIKHACPSLQTNATLINQKWCDFFKKHNYSPGVSIDGPKFLHDKNRVGKNGKGSFDACFKGVTLLKKNGINFGGLCVLTIDHLDYPDEIFDFFTSKSIDGETPNFFSVGFNTEEIETANKESSLFSKSLNQEIIDKYNRFFDRFIQLYDKSSKETQFREIYIPMKRLTINQNKELKEAYPMQAAEATPFYWLSLLMDGSIATFSPELLTHPKKMTILGNVFDDGPIMDIAKTQKFKNLYQSIKKGQDKCKATCAYWDVCGGGMQSNRYAESGSFEVSETFSCRLKVKETYNRTIKYLSVV